MAILFADSFKTYSDGTALKTAGAKWDDYVVGSGGGLTIEATGGRFGEAAVKFVARTRIRKKLEAAVATTITNVAFNFNNAIPAGVYTFMEWMNDTDSVIHCTLVVNTSGYIEFRRGGYGGTLLGTSSQAITNAHWYHLEVKVTLSDTAGTCEVKLDGTTILNLTGLDNVSDSSNNQCGAVAIGAGELGIGIEGARFDHCIIMDTSGSYNNDFIGDVRMRALLPTSDGSTNNFTPFAGTTNFGEVDEAEPDGDSTYTYSTTSGDIDLYGFGTFGINSEPVKGVVFTHISRRDDVGSRQIAPILLSGTATGTGGTRDLDTTYFGISRCFDTDPATGTTWDGTAVDNLEAGVIITG